MKKINTFVFLICLLTLPNLFAQSVELKVQNGYCIDSNYLYLNDTNGMSKNWQKIEWYNSNKLIQTNIKTSSKTPEIVVGVPTNIGNSTSNFFYPETMCRDSTGAIYVLDTGNNRVQKWLTGATSGVTVAGGNGEGSAANQLRWANGIFVDNSGNIYIADTGNNRIQKWAPGATEGVMVAYAYSPHSIFVDKKNNVYTDNGINSVYSIKKFAPGSPTEGKIVVGGISAGSGSNEFGGSGGFISFIYMDEKDNLYVTDNGNHRIQKFAPGETNGVTIAGGNGPGLEQNQLMYPFGFIFDTDMNLYIADSWNNRIQKWAPGATRGVTVAGGYGAGFEQNQFMYCQSVILDNSDMYILDRNNHRVQKWTIGSLNGSTFAGSANGAGFGSTGSLLKWPNNIAKDSTGNLYVADYNNSRVQKFTSGSTIGDKLSDFAFPEDVKVDHSDNIFVLDAGCNCVLKFNPGSTQGIVVAGGNGQGSNSNQFFSPMGIFIDKFENLYIADSYNNRIQKWAPGATSGVTVAGGNGAGSAANQLRTPISLSVDSDLNLFIVDQDNHRIQKWTPGANSGVTVAGGNWQGSGANQLNRPVGVFIDPIGNIYISDTGNNRVQKFGPGKTTGVTIVGGNGAGSQQNQLNKPLGILIDENNFLYITDSWNNRILKLDQTQILDTTFKGLTTGIFKAKVYDDLGNVFISNEITLNANPVIPTQTTYACNGIPFNFSPENTSPTATTIIPEGTTYTWTVAENPYVTGEANSMPAGKNSISQTLINTTTTAQTIIYTVIPTSGSGCQGAPFTLNVILTAIIQAPSADLIQTLDDGATLSNIVVSGTAVKWYTSATGGKALSNTTTLVNDGIYYASQILNTCESESRLMVTVKLNPFKLPYNNFAIETKSETCASKNNGLIIIKATQSYNYTATINGKNYNFINNGLTVPDLAPGVYAICIGVTGKTFEQCYSVAIGKGGSITGKSSVSSNKALVEITSGTAPFEILVNGTSQFETSENNFSVDVKQGDLLEIKTSAACEGIYSTNILDGLIGVIIHPNPTTGLFEITIPTSKTEVEIELYSISSQLISKRKYPIINQRVHLSLEKESNGIYFAKLNLDSPLSLTIIKKS